MAKLLIGNLKPPIATTSREGISKPDGTTIGINAEGTLSSLLKASGLNITDTEGLVGEANEEVTTQALINAIADKVANQLVSNNTLTTQLANYVTKSMIKTDFEDSTETVPASSLVNQLNSDIEEHFSLPSDGLHTAMQTKNGNTWRRLEIENANDDVRFFKSTDGGATWPTVKTLLTTGETGVEYWSGLSHNIVISSGGIWVEAPNKITVPPGTYIFMAHVTIPGNFNKFGKIQVGLDGLYETTQSWYPSNDIIEVNLTTFMTLFSELSVAVKISAEAALTVTSAEIAALRIK